MQYHKLKNTDVEVTIKSLGAELCSVIDLSSGIEYIWQADPAIWARHAPILFPIVGKLKDNTYSVNNKTYNLSQHGFARDKEFVCIEETADKLVFELTANEESLAQYPFHFSLQVVYELNSNALTVQYKVFNPDNQKLCFSVGAHPAFNCPLLPGETFTDYELYFSELQELTINKLRDGLISEETEIIKLHNHALPLHEQLFDNDALVMMNAQVSSVLLRSKKSANGVELISRNWPFFGIWTKKQTSEFVCLEPWYGIADMTKTDQKLENKTGIISLEPLKTFSCDYQLIFLK